MKLTRINKYIASVSLYSRREVDKLILEKRVSVNNNKVTEQGMKVDEDNDIIFIDGEPLLISLPETIKFYKPRGILTAYGDGRGKPTLENFEVFSNRKLPYSGRLDFDSEGLLIFSNDGELIQQIQRPEYKVDKEYYVTVNRILTEEELVEFASGLKTSTEKYKPCQIKQIDKKVYQVIIREGKKRQIRLMFRYFGSVVQKLIRVRIGTIKVGDLEPGEYKRLSDKEIREFRKCIELR